VVVGIVAFLLFGAKRLPELGKGLGEGLKGFREGIKGVTDPAPPPAAQHNVTPAPQPPVQQNVAAAQPPANPTEQK
jgi:sec-independent protein translocase protein TatA